MRLFGSPNVTRLAAKKDVKGLIEALDYKKDPGVRGSASIALGQIGDARAVEPLIVALKDKKLDVRTRAARALVQIGDARAVHQLAEFSKRQTEDQYACAKCGRTKRSILDDFERMKNTPGVYFMGGPALLWCDNCGAAFCGSCQVDLGLASGCPRCREELSHLPRLDLYQTKAGKWMVAEPI